MAAIKRQSNPCLADSALITSLYLGSRLLIRSWNFFQLIGVEIVDISIIFGCDPFQDAGAAGMKEKFVDLLEHLMIVFTHCPGQGFTFLDGVPIRISGKSAGRAGRCWSWQ